EFSRGSERHIRPVAQPAAVAQCAALQGLADTLPLLPEIGPAAVNEHSRPGAVLARRKHVSNDLVAKEIAVREGNRSTANTVRRCSYRSTCALGLEVKLSSVSFASQSTFPTFMSISVASVAPL